MHEKNAWDPRVDVYFQTNAWADRKFSNAWVARTLGRYVEENGVASRLLFCDGLDSQTTPEFETACKAIGFTRWIHPSGLTDSAQAAEEEQGGDQEAERRFLRDEEDNSRSDSDDGDDGADDSDGEFHEFADAFDGSVWSPSPVAPSISAAFKGARVVMHSGAWGWCMGTVLRVWPKGKKCDGVKEKCNCAVLYDEGGKEWNHSLDTSKYLTDVSKSNAAVAGSWVVLQRV